MKRLKGKRNTNDMHVPHSNSDVFVYGADDRIMVDALGVSHNFEINKNVYYKAAKNIKIEYNNDCKLPLRNMQGCYEVNPDSKEFPWLNRHVESYKG